MSVARPPVLLLGSGLTVLGTLRLLHNAGYAPLVLQGDAGIAARSSRYRAAPASSATGSAQDDLPAYLAGLPLDRAVLLPCSDAWVRCVARCADRVADRFPSSVSAASVLDRLVDKWHLSLLMRDLQLPHPRTINLEAGQSLNASEPLPMERAFIKPHDSAPFFAAFGVKGIRVESREDLGRQLERIAPTGLSVQLQEYVPGPANHHFYVEGFIDREGRLAALFVRQRLRMYPLDFGNSTLFASVTPAAAPDAVETVTRLLAHMNFRGIFSVELKRDARDGLCKVIDINARPWWYIEFAGQCGVNLCDLYVRDALGEVCAPVRDYTVGRRCVYPYYDYHACRALRANGTLTVAGWARSWLTATQPVFRWSDPRPALAETALLLKGRLRRLTSRSAHLPAARAGVPVP